MVRQVLFSLFVIAALAWPAPAQVAIQPNHPADVGAAAAPVATPAPVVAAPPATQPVDPKEHLPLGPNNAARGPATPSATADPGAPWLLTTLTALGAVIGLVLLLRVVLSKLTGRSVVSAHSPVVEVLSRTTVAPRNHVLLLRLGRRILVVGDSTAGLRTLADIDDPEEVAGLLQSIAASKPGSSTAGFSQLLNGFDQQHDEKHGRQERGNDNAELHVDRARDSVRGLLSRIRLSGKGSGG